MVFAIFVCHLIDNQIETVCVQVDLHRRQLLHWWDSAMRKLPAGDMNPTLLQVQGFRVLGFALPPLPSGETS